MNYEETAALFALARQHGMISDVDALRLLDLSNVQFIDGKPAAPAGFWQAAAAAHPAAFPCHASTMTPKEFQTGLSRSIKASERMIRAADDARDLDRIAAKYPPKAANP